MNEAQELVEFNAIESRLNQIKEEGNFLPDMSTKEGYEASKRYVLDVTAPAKKDLESARKKAKAYWIAGGKKLDSSAKSILEVIVECETSHKVAYRERDQKARIKKELFEKELQVKIDFFDEFLIDLSEHSQELIEELINSCGEVDTTEGFYHRSLDAAKARSEGLDHLNGYLVKAVNRDIEKARVKRLEEESKQREDELNRIKRKMEAQEKELDQAKEDKIKQLEENARVKAEQDAQEKINLALKEKQDAVLLAEQLKQDAINAEIKAKQDAINAQWLAIENDADIDNLAFDSNIERERDIERARQAEIKRQHDEQARLYSEAKAREANVEHHRKVNRDIIDVLVSNGISKEDAIKVVTLAAKKQLPKLIIQY